MEVGKPSQKGQSSRKGKRAWRKNIDIGDVEKGLEERREELIEHGEAIENVDSEDLFIIDDEADEKTVKKMKRENIKPLKSQEILNQRSKVAPLKVERNKRKIQGVDKKEIHRLMKLAGRVQGETQAKELLVKDGLVKSKSYDVWGEETEDPDYKEVKIPIPEVLTRSSGTSYTKATKAPSTLKQAPIKVRETEAVPHGGKSFNPSFEKWQDLIKQEYFREKTKEDQKIALEEHKKRILFLIDTLHDNELDEDSDEEEKEKEEENNAENENATANKEKKSGEEEGEEEDDEEEDERYLLSVNAPVVNKEKTKAQRNREKRHKERVRLETELKELKLRLKELEELPDTPIIEEPKTSEVSEKTKREKSEENKLKRNKKKLFKHRSIDESIEVKLSDELSDSLRKLKPEGNLFYDEMRKLQNSGKVEARVPLKQKKKYAPKITEKWTYKDFK